MEERKRLLGIAYRMLGSLAEAEDAVQEGYVRWYALPEPGRGAVVSRTAWLTAAVSRICLDVLGSARRRRERYVGEWLPEPVPGVLDRPGSEADPADLVARDDSLEFALLVVLETMTPAERVVFVLHDAFGYPFADIAAIVGRSAAACRQMASSARRRVDAGRRREAAPGDGERVVAAFKNAWQTGDPQHLVALLDPGATAVADGGGRVSAPAGPAVGAEAITAVLLGVHEKVPGLAVAVAAVNGRPGLVARDGSGAVTAVIAVSVEDGRIGRLWIMRNPEKLTAWRADA